MLYMITPYLVMLFVHLLSTPSNQSLTITGIKLDVDKIKGQWPIIVIIIHVQYNVNNNNNSDELNFVIQINPVKPLCPP